MWPVAISNLDGRIFQLDVLHMFANVHFNKKVECRIWGFSVGPFFHTLAEKFIHFINQRIT